MRAGMIIPQTNAPAVGRRGLALRISTPRASLCRRPRTVGACGDANLIHNYKLYNVIINDCLEPGGDSVSPGLGEGGPGARSRETR